jgi:hypothetical protein
MNPGVTKGKNFFLSVLLFFFINEKKWICHAYLQQAFPMVRVRHIH